MICRTVSEIITELQKLPPETTPISLEPPFDGVALVAQSNGKVLFGRPLLDGESWSSYKNTPKAA